MSVCRFQKEGRLESSWTFPFSVVPQGKRIVLYGAGKVGQAFYRQLTALSWAKEIIWTDQNAEGYERLPDGRRLFAPAELAALDFDVVVLAVADRVVAESIARTLAALGVAEEKLLWGCLPASVKLRKTAHFARLVEPALRELKDVGTRMGLSTDVMASWQSRIRDAGALVLPRLVVELTNRCTLRCRHCNNLMPLVKTHWDADPEQVIADVRRILAAVDGVVKMELLGGETFVYKELPRVIDALLDEPKILQLEFTTNGTVQLRDDVLERLAHPKCFVRVSRYDCVTQAGAFVKRLAAHHVAYCEMEELQWVDPGAPAAHGKTAEQLRENFVRCPSAYLCKTLLDGKLYACARGASLFQLGFIQEHGEAFVDVREGNALRDRIRAFFEEDKNIVCDYCTIVDAGRPVKAGEQLPGTAR